MQIYLSGPITDCPNNNKEAFDIAAKKLRAMGHEVFNPRELNDGDSTSLPREWYMRRCIDALLKLPTGFGDGAICLLPHWNLSVGSCLEFRIANELNLRILIWPEGIETPLGLEA